MNIIKSTYFPIVPMAAMRATQNMSWIAAISEKEAAAEDAKWVLRDTGIGRMYVKTRIDKKTGQPKEYARKSPPNYVRQRRHLIAHYENKRAIKEYADSIGFEMPQDCYMIVIKFPMPKSWTKKKKAKMDGERHKSRPDKDNCEKGIIDSIYYKDKHSRFQRKKGDTDAMVSSGGVIKLWAYADAKIGFWINEYDRLEWDNEFL
jgi:Holliday junction resolvase RusA-like endonuclease